MTSQPIKEQPYRVWLRQLPSSQLPSGQLPSSRPEPSVPLAPYLLTGAATVGLGRDPRCQIVLESTRYRSVSRRHAEVSPVAGFALLKDRPLWQVCDLNSANGTFVNGQRLQNCQVLQSGDRIMLGQDGPVFIFEIQSEESPILPARKGRSKLVSRGPRSTERSPHPVAAVSLSQLFPILSAGPELTRKAYLLPGMVTVAWVVLLFLAVGEPQVFNWLLAAYLSGAAYYFVYQLCGKHKPWWMLAGMAGLTALILVSPVLNLFLMGFRDWLPGKLPKDLHSVSFPVLLVRMFFGAGLMEELLKALPVLGACLVGGLLQPPWRDRLGVREPLDGILLGAASAVGFTLMETLGQYVPEAYYAMLQSGEEAAQLASLQLLIPRVLGSVAGHLAYSGYLGYFIGLSVLRPQKRWLILSVGYLTAAALHTLWNAMGVVSPVLLAIVGVLSYAFLAAAILKARELSPGRSQNFATQFYK